VLAQGGPVLRFDLPQSAPAAASPAPIVPGASFREIERHAIMATYEACGRSPLRTADVLGISPRTVHYRLREYSGQPGRRALRAPGAQATGAWSISVVCAEPSRHGRAGPEN
jgi:hypothetical protein